MLDGGSAMDAASSMSRRDLRLQVAQRQVPEILTWAGAMTLVFALVNYLTLSSADSGSWIINLLFGPLFIILAWLIHSGRIPMVAVPWVWALCSLALVAMLANGYRLDPSPAALAYLAAVMAAFGALTHSWPPFIVAAVGMLGVSTAVFAVTPGTDVVESGLVCVVTLGISAALLRLRIGALDALADTQAQLDRQATYDALTDVLNRNGLRRAIPSVVAGAQRSGAPILVWFVDVRGLKAANDRFGHDLGDAIIRAVARALRGCVRTNDIVGRWGGDEFIVLGTGGVAGLGGTTAEELNERLDAALAVDPELEGRWRGSVTVGFASGLYTADVDRLIQQADMDMYRRRGADPGR